MVYAILEVRKNISKKQKTMSNAAERSGKMNTEKVWLYFTIWR